MIKVFLTEDHAMLRESLAMLLDDDPSLQLVGQAATGEETLKMARSGDWDVLVLDLSLPTISGIDVLKKMRESFPKIAVIVLTMHSIEQYAFRVMRSGASSFLTKDGAPETLIQAIKTVSKGKKYLTPDVAQLLAEKIDDHSTGNPIDQLTNREFEVFQLAAEGLSNKEIEGKLLISISTIDTHKRRIVEKLGLSSAKEFSRYAYENNLFSGH